MNNASRNSGINTQPPSCQTCHRSWGWKSLIIALQGKAVDESDRGLFETGDKAANATSERGMNEQRCNRDNESALGGDESFGNTAGERLGIAAAEQCDQLEGVDHARDRSQQSQQWRNGGGQTDKREPAFQPRANVQHSFVEHFFEQFLLLVRIVDGGFQQIASRPFQRTGVITGLGLLVCSHLFEDQFDILRQRRSKECNLGPLGNPE